MASLSYPLTLDDCVNETCPWSGEPVSEDALTIYRGQVVGFCNPGCRDKFDKALDVFGRAIDEKRRDRA